MAMLDRYRKPGGFQQLLSLVETCNAAKREKLLEVIGEENARWSELVRMKMLSIDRIYSWNDEALMEILGSLQDLTVAVALRAAPNELRIRLNGLCTHGRRRKIEDLFGTNEPSANEITATHLKIVESVRRMENEGQIHFEKIDPTLVLGENLDQMLNETAITTPLKTSESQKVLTAYSTLAEQQGASSPVTDSNSESRVMEIQTLKKRVAELSKETAVLRHELSMAKSKLDQIRKIA